MYLNDIITHFQSVAMSPVVRAVIAKLDPDFDFSTLDNLDLAERPDLIKENEVHLL